MTTMPINEIQEQHQAMPGVSMLQYLISAAKSAGTPVPERTEGEARAELNMGRWIVKCLECAGQVLVTSISPRTFCPDCGAGWWDVIFPANKVAIHEELFKRPTIRGRMVFANWTPYGGLNYLQKPTGKAESISQLRRQTQALWIIDEANRRKEASQKGKVEKRAAKADK